MISMSEEGLTGVSAGYTRVVDWWTLGANSCAFDAGLS